MVELVECPLCLAEVSELFYTITDGPACEGCAHTTCTACGCCIHIDEAIWVNDDCLCSSCIELCHCCGHYVAASDTHDAGNRVICDACRLLYYYACYNCGDLVHEDYTYEAHGDYYCSLECAPASGINEYSYKPRLRFHGAGIFMGVELEFELCGACDEDVARGLRERFDEHDELFTLKKDSSLDDGIELVTQPCSLLYHQERFPWYEILKQLTDEGCKSHDTKTCGLHVHVDRRRMTKTHRVKLSHFVTSQKERLEQIARRNESSYAAFRKKKPAPSRHDDSNGNRYEAINWQNRDTVEFRLYRGTLQYETLMATIELTHAIVQFIKTISVVKVCDADETWEMFLDYVLNEKQYKFAYNYLEQHRLLRRKEDNQCAS